MSFIARHLGGMGDIKDAFLGADSDKRRVAVVSRLHDAIVAQSSLVVRKLGADRGGELATHRVLSSPHVTPRETLACLTRPTGRAVAGRRVVLAQDTTEFNFAGRQSRGLGPAGNRDPRLAAALGGWNCYYKPPGPRTMRDGWQRFTAIEGFNLAQHAHVL